MFEWEKESMAKKRRRKINKDIIKSAKKKKKSVKEQKVMEVSTLGTDGNY